MSTLAGLEINVYSRAEVNNVIIAFCEHSHVSSLSLYTSPPCFDSQLLSFDSKLHLNSSVFLKNAWVHLFQRSISQTNASLSVSFLVQTFLTLSEVYIEILNMLVQFCYVLASEATWKDFESSVWICT